MAYKLYLFQTTYPTHSYGFQILVRNLLQDSHEKNGLAEFNILDVQSELNKVFADSEPLAEPIAKHIKYNTKKGKYWLTIVTSCSNATLVVEKLMLFAIKHNLILLNAQTEQILWSQFEACCIQITSANIRKNDICHRIYKNIRRIYTLRKIEDHSRWGTHNISYVLTLRFMAGKTLQERTQEIYDLLLESLAKNEELICENHCFTVRGIRYNITFCIEAYNKHEQWRCNFHDGAMCIHPLGRMGIETAFSQKAVSKEMPSYSQILTRMNIDHMLNDFPNPADRFIESVLIEKSIAKIGLGIDLHSRSGFHGEFSFYRESNHNGDDETTVSNLAMPEEAACLVLDVIKNFYPEIYDRYYGHSYISHEMWSKVIDKIHYIMYLLRKDTSSEYLESYFERLKNCMLYNELDGAILEKDDLAGAAKRLNRFYKFFIYWLEKQLKHDWGHSVIHISGP